MDLMRVNSELTLASKPAAPHAAGGGVTRRRVLVVAGGGTAGALVACGLGDVGQVVPRAPKGSVKISFMTDWASGARQKAIEDSLAIWREKYPDVSVEYIPNTQIAVKVPADFAAGTPADVILGLIGSRDNYLDIRPLLKRDRIDLREFVQVDPYYQYKGGQCAMPFQLNMAGVYVYNQSLFLREGIAAPTERWTWADLSDAARRAARPDQKQWGLVAEYSQLFRVMVRSSGSFEISQDFKRSQLTSAQAQEAAQWIVDRIRDRSLVPYGRFPEAEDVLQAGQSSVFQTGRAGMFNLNAGQVGSLAGSPDAGQFAWDTMPSPKAPRTGKVVPILGDGPHAVSRRPNRTAEQTDAAFLFLLFMSGPEVMELLAEGRTSIPIFRKVLNGPRYLRRPPESMGLIPKLVDVATYRAVFDGWREWNTAVDAQLQKAWSGDAGVDAALQNAQRAGEAVLDQFQRRA